MAWLGFDSTLPRQFEHRRGHIDSDDLSRWPDHLRCDQTIEASATANIDDPLAGLELAAAKRVARASERRDRAFRNTFQPFIGVAKHANEWTARVEVIASTRISCHSCVFFLDRLTQATQIKARFCQWTVAHHDLLIVETPSSPLYVLRRK